MTNTTTNNLTIEEHNILRDQLEKLEDNKKEMKKARDKMNEEVVKNRAIIEEELNKTNRLIDILKKCLEV